MTSQRQLTLFMLSSAVVSSAVTERMLLLEVATNAANEKGTRLGHVDRLRYKRDMQQLLPLFPSSCTHYQDGINNK